jgi:hypothetical protein
VCFETLTRLHFDTYTCAGFDNSIKYHWFHFNTSSLLQKLEYKGFQAYMNYCGFRTVIFDKEGNKSLPIKTYASVQDWKTILTFIDKIASFK